MRRLNICKDDHRVWILLYHKFWNKFIGACYCVQCPATVVMWLAGLKFWPRTDVLQCLIIIHSLITCSFFILVSYAEGATYDLVSQHSSHSVTSTVQECIFPLGLVENFIRTKHLMFILYLSLLCVVSANVKRTIHVLFSFKLWIKFLTNSPAAFSIFSARGAHPCCVYKHPYLSQYTSWLQTEAAFRKKCKQALQEARTALLT